jgi:hypothetical protein
MSTLRDFAEVCTVAGEYPIVGKPKILQQPDTAAKAGGLKQGEESHASKGRKFLTKARNSMLRGIKMLANTAKITLRSEGRNVVPDKSYGTRTTKDRFAVTKEI